MAIRPIGYPHPRLKEKLDEAHLSSCPVRRNDLHCGRLVCRAKLAIPLESSQSGKNPVAQSVKAGAGSSQLSWLDHWVAKAMAHADPGKE
jgi:hypothetical protein